MSTVYQLKVTLDDTKPPIWRRVLTPDMTTMGQLHTILQTVMGWENNHLHIFTINGQRYGDPEEDETGLMETKNETRFKLNQLVHSQGVKFRYAYDFGDGWEHTILVEKILPAEKGVHYPVCVSGKRACPPEDVGGVWGYEDFLKAIADPNHEEYDECLEWVGGTFDPEAFDLEAVNESLQAIKPTRGGKTTRPVMEPEDDFMPPGVQQKEMMNNLLAWAQSLSQEQAGILESLPLRRDVLTFVDYLAKNRTVGTQSTGNLPLKAVKAICEKFVHPPALEETIGDHTYKVRSEDEVWPLVFVHHLALNAKLVTGGQAQTWKVTPEGQQLFPQLPPPVQVFFLLVHWWGQVDWAIALPVWGLGHDLPAGFKEQALACLTELPIGENVSHDAFADRLIAQSGLKWHSPDPGFAHSIMRSAVQRTVVHPMTAFGALECEYIKENIGRSDFTKLQTIRLTTIGKGLLDLLK